MDAEFLPAGIDRATLKPLARRSDRAGLTRLAGHSATLAGTGALVLLAAGQPVLLVPAMALHGAVLMFLFAPLHETAFGAFRFMAQRPMSTWCTPSLPRSPVPKSHSQCQP